MFFFPNFYVSFKRFISFKKQQIQTRVINKREIFFCSLEDLYNKKKVCHLVPGKKKRKQKKSGKSFKTRIMLNRGFRIRSNKILENHVPKSHRWCKYCNQLYMLSKEHIHLSSMEHKTAVNGNHGLIALSKEMWKRHRGGTDPLTEDISVEKESEIMKHMPRAESKSRVLKGPTVEFRNQQEAKWMRKRRSMSSQQQQHQQQSRQRPYE